MNRFESIHRNDRWAIAYCLEGEIARAAPSLVWNMAIASPASLGAGIDDGRVYREARGLGTLGRLWLEIHASLGVIS